MQMRGMESSKKSGFTLIELVIAIAVVAILAAVALPAYQSSVQKARRSDAKDALLRVQIEQEKWRTNSISYTGSLSVLNLSSTSSEGYYNIEITPGTASPTGFEVTATATGAQADDSTCPVITLQVSAGSETRIPPTCW